LARVTSTSGQQRREGVIIDVLDRNTETLVGRFYQEKGVSFVKPDDKQIAQDIIIPTGEQQKAKSGQYVLVELISQPTRRRQPTARVLEILGDHLTPGVEVELSIRSHDLPFCWPEKLKQYSQKISKTIKKSEINKRKDLRPLPFVTIDGENAKDFDDAVYCEARPQGGWRLYVAIADVSHYVKPGSVLDEEAKERGNSVYFPSCVIPMLPEILSNELCSLKPDVDRLAVVCEMVVSPTAKVTRSQFYEAVIHSNARLTYHKVAQWLSDFKTITPNLSSSIQNLYNLYKILLHEKKKRGAIEFETIETRILFDREGKIDRIIPVERTEAHKIIEEIMLLANVTAASFLEKIKLPAPYRIHESPNEPKLLALRDFLKTFGLRLPGGEKPTSKDYANLLQRVEKRPDAHLLQMVILRSLPQAIYLSKNLGHFGLSYERYCHFTSPIRRYPDLLVHRAIKHQLHVSEKKKSASKNFIYTEEEVDEFSDHCSFTERRADIATRDAEDWLKCDYMMSKLGQEFDGIISDVTAFGVFVELKNVYVQGLLHVTSLVNDYYCYEPIQHLLRGRRSGKVYRLGDAIQVLVARVDLDERKIDFELPSQLQLTKKKKKKTKKTKERKKSASERKVYANSHSVA